MKDYSEIESFLARVKLMTKSRSKELRLSLEEATMLAANVGELLAEIAKSNQKEEVVNVVMTGGDFTSM